MHFHTIHRVHGEVTSPCRCSARSCSRWAWRHVEETPTTCSSLCEVKPLPSDPPKPSPKHVRKASLQLFASPFAVIWQKGRDLPRAAAASMTATPSWSAQSIRGKLGRPRVCQMRVPPSMLADEAKISTSNSQVPPRNHVEGICEQTGVSSETICELLLRFERLSGFPQHLRSLEQCRALRARGSAGDCKATRHLNMLRPERRNLHISGTSVS